MGGFLQWLQPGNVSHVSGGQSVPNKLCTHTRIHAYTHTHIHTYTHTQTYKHIHTHTHPDERRCYY